MIPRGIKSEGIILARKNFGEADRILIVYSRNFGRLHFIAKGVRKPKSKKRGHLEVFSYVNFSAARTKSLGIITEVETLDSFEKIREDLKKVSLAYFFMEVIGHVTKEEEVNEDLFDLLLNYIHKLKKTKKLRKLKEDFIYETLVLLGFWPKKRTLSEPDRILEGIVERKVSTSRVGKRLLE